MTLEDRHDRTLRHFWEDLLSYRRVIGASLLIGLGAATAYNLAVPPSYEAVAVLSVKERQFGAGGSRNTDRERQEEVVRGQISALQRPEFLERQVRNLTPGEVGDLARGPMRTLVEKLRVRFEQLLGRTWDPLPQAALVDVLAARLDFTWKTPSSWIEIRFRAADRASSSSVLNRLITDFVTFNEQLNAQETALASGEIDAYLSQRKSALDRALSTEKTGGQDPQERREELRRQAESLTAVLATAEADRVRKSLTLRQREQDADTDPRLVALNARLASLQERERSLLRELGERHPDVAAVREQVAVTRAEAAGLRTSIRQAARSEYEVAAADEGRLRRQLAAVRAEAAALGTESVDEALARKTEEAARASLSALVERRQAAADTFIEARVVQMAFVPVSPVDPDWPRNLLMGLLAGALLSGFLVWASEQFRNAPRFPEDLRRIEGLRCLGVLPEISARGDVRVPAAVMRPGSFPDAVRHLRTNLEHVTKDARRSRVLVVSSAGPQEGKSTTSLAVALLLRESASRILLIDADLRRPSLHRQLNLPLAPGIASVLTPDAKEPLRPRALDPRLDVLPAGGTREASAALLGSNEMKVLIDWARKNYEWVVIDTPPALALPDAATLARISDGVVLVCASEKTSLRDIEAAFRGIEGAGGTVLGAVLNRVDMARHSYYYERAYASYYGAERES